MGLLMILAGTLMYVKGECWTKLLGNPNSWFKYLMGIPIGLIGWLFGHPEMLWSILFYFIACEFGYGDNNPLTKWLGKRGAITFCGVALGLASVAIIREWCLLQGLISGISFYYISVLDDKELVKEPCVAIFRSLGGLCLLPFLHY